MLLMIIYFFFFLVFGKRGDGSKGAAPPGRWGCEAFTHGVGSNLHPAVTATGAGHHHQMGVQSKEGSHSRLCWGSVGSVPSHDV